MAGRRARGSQSPRNGTSLRVPPHLPIDGVIELVGPGDPPVGENGENAGKIKLRAWRGPAFIRDPVADAAGVGWILAENWWPYRRPTFVTPPFAG